MFSADSALALPMFSTSRPGTSTMKRSICADGVPLACARRSSSDWVYMSRNSLMSLAPTRCQLPLCTSRLHALAIWA